MQALYGAELDRLATAGYVDLTRGLTLTVDDLRSAIRETEQLIANSGLSPGEVVAVWTEPPSAFLVNFLAALASGLIVVPLDAHQSHLELTRRVLVVGARALLADDDQRHGLTWTSAAGLPVLPEQPDKVRARPRPDYPPDAAMVLFTSGSTGPSKPAVITHTGLIQNALATAEWQCCAPTDTIGGTISLFHCFAILHTVLAPFLAGAAVIAMAPFSPTKTIDAARRYRLTILPGTPAMFEMLLRHDGFSQVDWSTLRCGCSGGSLLRPETQARFLRSTGAPLLNGYGITEATSFVSSPPIGERNQPPYSLGRPISGVSCRVAEGSGEADAGELEVGGAAVMAGYLADPIATEAVITSDGWLRTGDRVRIAADGEIFYVGRIKNVINRGGEKIHPELVEAAVGAPYWVRHLVAVGVPDPILGERIAVLVEAAEGDFNEIELRTRAEQLLVTHERPEWYVRVDALPRTPTGKINLTGARELAGHRLGLGDDANDTGGAVN